MPMDNLSSVCGHFGSLDSVLGVLCRYGVLELKSFTVSFLSQVGAQPVLISYLIRFDLFSVESLFSFTPVRQNPASRIAYLI